MKNFVLCIQNKGYEDIQKLKVYEVIDGDDAEEVKEMEMIRIIDESGEDYLYPAEYFVTINLPEIAQAIFEKVNI